MANVTQKPLSDVPSINGLLWDGWKWSDPVITFAFPTSVANGGYGAVSGFQALDTWSNTDPYVLGANFAFSQIRSFTNLRVLEMQGGDSLAGADIKIAMAEGRDTNGDKDFNDSGEMFAGGTLAAGAPPSPGYGGKAGRIFIDPTPSGTGDPRGTLMHEIGHALGLKHPFETTKAYSGEAGTAPVLDSKLDNWEYTVMAYGNGDEPSTYMQLDIQALQYLYGANYDYNSTSTTYRWDPVTGEMFVNGSGQGAPANGKIFMTVWDGGGSRDTYDFSNYTTGVTVDLNPGKSSVTSAAQLASYGGTTAKGNVYNALLFEGDERSLIENANGGSGNDKITGNGANNVLRGNGGNDELRGEGGADTMVGGSGNDTYYVTDRGDRVIENFIERGNGLWISGGTDTVVTSLRSYTLGDAVENLTIGANPLGKGLSSVESTGYGNDLDNVLTGRRGKETLYGFDGNDTLNGGRNADTMIGGRGNDTYYVDDVGDVVDETEYVSGGGTGIARRNSGYRDVGSDNDTVVTTLSSYDLSNVGSNSMFRYLFPSTLYGTIENLAYTGTGQFTGIGNDANNVIAGGALGDSLIGGRGHDTIYAGTGNDGILLGEGDDKTYIDNGTAAGGDVVVGGGGYDAVYADDSTIAGGWHLNVFRAGTGFTPDVNQVAFTSAAIDVDFVEGNAGNDVIDASRVDQRIDISGMGGEDTIIGGSAGDNLYGGDEADTIIGGAGGDGMDGGNGSDTFVMDNGTELGGDVAVGGEGYDIVRADAGVASTGLRLVLFPTGTGFTPDVNQVAHTSAAMDVEEVQGGTGNDWVDASRLAVDEDVDFLGNEGNDTFLSGGGDDTFDGGADTDTIVYSGPASNYQIEPAGEKYPWLAGVTMITDRTTGHIDLVRDVEIVKFGDGSSVQLTASSSIVGTEGNDVLVGDGADNVIKALGGDDVLRGGGGRDSLDGGAGRDVLEVDSLDKDIKGGEGFDIVFADATTQATGLHFAVAGSGVEAVFGNAGNDVLDASGSADYQTMLFAGNGDDVLTTDGKGAYTLQGGAGVDTAVFAGNQSDYIIDAHPAGWPSWMTVTEKATGAVSWLQTVERLQFADGTIDAPGQPPMTTGTADGDVITAGDGGAVVHGLGGDDRVTGGAGDDIIDGGAGADQLSGGSGNDSFFVDNADTFIDGGEGYDSVYADDTQGAPATLHLSLAGTNVEFVYGGVGGDVIDATGVSASVDLWGQWGDDVLTGGAGADSLLGDEWLAGGGADVLDGGAGNDTLSGGNDNDTFVFRAGSGLDTVTDFGQAGDRDVIRIEGGLFASFDALSASGAMTQVGADVVIALGATDQITLQNVTLSDLDAGDFQLVPAQGESSSDIGQDWLSKGLADLFKDVAIDTSGSDAFQDYGMLSAGSSQDNGLYLR